MATFTSEESPNKESSVTVSKDTLLQLINALSTSARLLQENIESAGTRDTRGNQQSETKPPGPEYKEVETTDLEKIGINHAMIARGALKGRNGNLLRHYKSVYGSTPFQQDSILTTNRPNPNYPSHDPNICIRLQNELWELLLEYRYAIYDLISPHQPLAENTTEELNKHEFLLLVNVISEKLGQQDFSVQNEEEYRQTLNMLVSICGASHLYIDCTCHVVRDGDSLCKHRAVNHSGRCLTWSHMRIGTVLSGLYAEGILQKPADTDLVSLRLNAARVMQALRTICPEALHSNEILNLKMSDLILLVSKEHKSDWLRATGPSFPTRLVNVRQLRNIGNINIEWTSNLYEHLELSFNGYATLKIYWFAWSTLELPIARMGTFAQNSREELLSTYHLLFGVPSRDSFMTQSKNALNNYNKIQTHPSLIRQDPKIHPRKRVGKLATKDGRPYNFGAEYHLPLEKTHVSSIARTDNPQDLYANFPVFEEKLRILVAFMDTQKPGGLRGLWYDKRDSSAWFTFWAVLWIGGVSLILSLLSLGATITQTMVGFKALQMDPYIANGTIINILEGGANKTLVVILPPPTIPENKTTTKLN